MAWLNKRFHRIKAKSTRQKEGGYNVMKVYSQTFEQMKTGEWEEIGQFDVIQIGDGMDRIGIDTTKSGQEFQLVSCGNGFMVVYASWSLKLKLVTSVIDRDKLGA